MTMIVCRQFRFEAAHFLPGHPTCGEMHGHSYKVDVALEGLLDPKTQMLMDFHVMGEKVNSVLAELDHSVLNDTVVLPTAERLAIFLFRTLQPILFSGISVLAGRITGVSQSYMHKLLYVQVWETEDCYAKCDQWIGS